jgi:hypothetical protein
MQYIGKLNSKKATPKLKEINFRARHIGKGFFLSKIIFSILLLSLSVHIYSNHKIPICSPLLRQLKTQSNCFRLYKISLAKLV